MDTDKLRSTKWPKLVGIVVVSLSELWPIRPAGEMYNAKGLTLLIPYRISTVNSTKGRYAADKVLISSTIDQKDVADNLHGSSECSSILA